MVLPCSALETVAGTSSVSSFSTIAVFRTQEGKGKPFISKIAANDLAYCVFKVGEDVYATEVRPMSDGNCTRLLFARMFLPR